MQFDLTCHDLEIQELEQVAEIHSAAFPDSALTALGKHAVELYYEWQMTGPHDAVALGGYVDGSLGGFCYAGRFNGALSGFLRKNRAYLILRVATHPWLVTNALFRERLYQAGRILWRRKRNPIQKPTKNTWVNSFGILSIAVHPDFQGIGLGKLLIDETEQIAQLRGFTQMHLTVSTANFKAIRFYERQGWIKSPTENWQGGMVKILHNESI